MPGDVASLKVPFGDEIHGRSQDRAKSRLVFLHVSQQRVLYTDVADGDQGAIAVFMGPEADLHGDLAAVARQDGELHTPGHPAHLGPPQIPRSERDMPGPETLGHQRLHLHPHQRFGGIAQQVRGEAVGEQQAPVVTHGDHGLGRVLQQCEIPPRHPLPLFFCSSGSRITGPVDPDLTKKGREFAPSGARDGKLSVQGTGTKPGPLGARRGRNRWALSW